MRPQWRIVTRLEKAGSVRYATSATRQVRALQVPNARSAASLVPSLALLRRLRLAQSPLPRLQHTFFLLRPPLLPVVDQRKSHVPRALS